MPMKSKRTKFMETVANVDKIQKST